MILEKDIVILLTKKGISQPRGMILAYQKKEQ